VEIVVAMANLIASNEVRVIVGLGQTGVSCARFFAARGLSFMLADTRVAPPMLQPVQAEFPNARIFCGDIAPACEIASELVVSPGVALEQPAIAAAIARGVKISSDIELFLSAISKPVVAITGANGKSTVTTLVAEFARACGINAPAVGNVGVAVLELLDEKGDERAEFDAYVIELSSFQLERLPTVNAAVATILNITPDHMDRYAGLADYHRAKQRVYFGARKVVVNRADKLTEPRLVEGVKRTGFGLDVPDLNCFGIRVENGRRFLARGLQILMPVDEVRIQGEHNIANALAALALGEAMGWPLPPMLVVLREFSGLAHRAQHVASRDGVDFINDSKGTNVGASIAAIEGLCKDGRKVVLIAGGEDKNSDFLPLINTLAKHGRALVLIGSAADKIAAVAASRLAVARAGSMNDAVRTAARLAQQGDVVLLSPACASFDMFNNYQHRGDVFSDCVRTLLQEAV
jgi:UDP-N-acetylmuramoylalanine--D-glutamate ligase